MAHATDSFWGGILKSMGLVFGDIGTSPIYTLTVIFTLTEPTRDNIFGIISLILWTLTILVTVEYAWLATSLSRNGEGGAIVLKEILAGYLKSGRKIAFSALLCFLGVSLLLGDGVITPAISILSAVEGIHLIPGGEGVGQGWLIALAALIAIGLFIFQYKGTDKVALAFGPIMGIWFGALAFSGLLAISQAPEILQAVSPHYALKFMLHHGVTGFFVLSEVILCATGGEALYADMGHLGRAPIIRAWSIVFVALAINYLGQGAYLLQHPETKSVLFEMIHHQAALLYVPFLLLTIAATIIASQALISGVFSIVYQGITTRVLPLLKVDYTSRALKSQIYIGSVNWALMVAVILIMILFRESGNLAAAYGLAVTGSMSITGVMMIMIFALQGRRKLAAVAGALTVIDLIFFGSCMTKIPHGGYWSIILAAFPFASMLLWTHGQRALYQALRPLDLETFLVSYEQVYKRVRIPGTALFFTREAVVIPPYVIHCMLRSNIVYERNIFISIDRTDTPFGVETSHQPDLGPGLEAFGVTAGYMELLDIDALLKANKIKEKVIFYGIEDIATSSPLWKIFALFKRLTPNFVQFNKLPASRLQGVVTRVEM
jgi:KUP system potassium uptake protein